MVSVAVLFCLALLAALRRKRSWSNWFGPFCLFTGLISAGLLSYVITHVPFVAFGNHILFVLPFFVLWAAKCITSIQSPVVRWGLAGGLMAAHLVGLANYYGGQDLHNPIYLVPAREIVAGLEQEAQPGDIILASSDIGIGFYAERSSGWSVPILSPYDEESVIAYLDSEIPSRVWLFVFGRDRTRRDIPAGVRDRLQSQYRQVDVRRYVEQDSIYRQVKSVLFGREAYTHKLTLYVYERADGAH